MIPKPSQLARLLSGLVLYGLADAAMIQAHVGVDPWTVFAQGFSHLTGWGIGVLTNVIGVAVLLLWWPLRQRPGIGTVLNILVIGPAIELGLWLLPRPEAMAGRVVSFTLGLLALAVASGLYIGAGLGPGPRDGLMTGAHARFGWPLWVPRTAVEVTVLAVGWALGGDVGIGTAVFALAVGPLCNVTLPLLRPRSASRPSAGDGTAQVAETLGASRC